MTQIAEFDRLMADVVAGSEEAVWQLAEIFTPYIIRAVRLSLSPRLRPKLDSQDFAQTLWASLLLKRADLTRLKSPEQLIAYLAQAAKNKVIDKTRHFKTQKHNIDREEENLDDHSTGKDGRKSRSPARSLYSREPTPSTSASLRERWNQILSNSSERDRRILTLRLKGCTFDSISGQLQINEATARRAMQRLIEQLSE
jgi:RNA polymerase sigma factor (sigma-70 family)